MRQLQQTEMIVRGGTTGATEIHFQYIVGDSDDPELRKQKSFKLEAPVPEVAEGEEPPDQAAIQADFVAETVANATVGHLFARGLKIAREREGL